MWIYKLPTEILSMILRYLDDRSLINASRVNILWCLTCEQDPVLKHRIKKHEERRKRLRWRGRRSSHVSSHISKLPKDVTLKRKIRLLRYKLLLTLITLRDLWQEFQDSLLV